jgi:branched-chain amino acid transport system ATP-binding protein
MERVLDLFPRLGERMDNGGTQLSGGEQQMLSIARGLLMNPKLLILDEPTEGLAPIIVKLIHDKLQELKADGLSMIIVEQNFGFATSLADDVVVVGKGQIVWTGSAAEIRADEEAQHTWLGV